MNNIPKIKTRSIVMGTVTLGLGVLMILSLVEPAVFMNQLQFITAKEKSTDSSSALDNRMQIMSERWPELVTPTTTDTTTSSPSVQSEDEGDFTAQAEISNWRIKRTNDIVNTQAYYDIVFFTESTAPIKSIEVIFPEGFIIDPFSLVVEVEGIGPGVAAKTDSRTITYTVDDDVIVPAKTKIRLEFSRIINPPNPGSDYKVVVLTKNAGGAIIDGPKGSVPFNMKQIETADIANGAITTNKLANGAVNTGKLANGAVTEDKVSPSFMTSKILNDGQNGWDPGDIIVQPTEFIISDPNVHASNSHVYISVDEPADVAPLIVNVVCMVEDISNGSFQVVCDLPPAEGSKLRYTVINQA